jgi:hypothetical protein
MYVIMRSYKVNDNGKDKIVEDVLGVGVTKLAYALFDKFVNKYSYYVARSIINFNEDKFIYNTINMYRVELDGIPDTSFPVRQFSLSALAVELYAKYGKRLVERRRRRSWSYLMDNDK